MMCNTVRSKPLQSRPQVALPQNPKVIDDKVGLCVDSIHVDVSRSQRAIRLDALPFEKREVVESALQRTRRNLAANVVLLNKDDQAMTLTAQLARTALGQLRGSIDLVAPARSKHVGIFFDVTCSGEATRRPHLRIPPLRGGRRGHVETVVGGCPRTLGAAAFAHGDGRSRGVFGCR